MNEPSPPREVRDIREVARENRDAAPRESDPVIGSMMDMTSLLILSATSGQPKTVRDLSVELNLPIASLYRRVRALQSAGVLSAEKVKDRTTGKETMFYHGLVSSLRVRFAAPDPVVELDFRNEADAEE